MSYLLYCIAQAPASVSERIEGVAGRPVTIIKETNLAAVVSALPQGETGRQLDKLVSYARVVEAFNRQRTVIPMRFGCVLPTTAAIRELLVRHACCYRKTFGQLDNCIEMGIRILPRSEPELSLSLRREPRTTDEACKPGVTYLNHRRAELVARENGLQDCQRIADELRARLAGLFKQSRVETDRLGSHSILSVFFLVTREATEQFREATSRFCAAHSSAVLLTGPWPPYNFVGKIHHGRATTSG